MRRSFLLLVLISLVWESESYSVLLLSPVVSKSVYSVLIAIAEALGEVGHKTVVVSTVSPVSEHKNVREVHTGDRSFMEYKDINMFAHLSFSSVINWGIRGQVSTSHYMYNNPEILELYKNRNSFDAIIITGYFNEIAVPFLFDYKGPFIALCTPGVEYDQMAMQGNWLPLSVVPNIVLPYDENMAFQERMLNFLTFFVIQFYKSWYIVPFYQNLIEKYFPGAPPYDIAYANRSLTLVNGNFVMDTNLPLLQNQVEIGTIHIKPLKPLPKDIEEFIDGAGEAGAIFFSLGSIGKGKYLPAKYKEILLAAFQKIPQRILWKYEAADLVPPPNIMIKEWMPQREILGHPKTKLFISHCGNLGTQEAKYYGVPMLALPITFDQPRNAARMARKGIGLVLHWEELTVDKVIEAIHELINNTTYRKKIQQISQVLKDRKETPAERVRWWVEYTIRNHGAPHMEYPGRKLNILQYFLVDVILFWILIILICLFALHFICKTIIGLVCGESKKKKD